MATPTFSRIEIRHINHDSVIRAAAELRSLADKMTELAAKVEDRDLMHMAVHNEIRETSQKLREEPTTASLS